MSDFIPRPAGASDLSAAHDRDEILAAITEIARDELDHDGAVMPDHRLVEDLELDSIRVLTLATAVEDHFRILLDEADETSIVTVADLITVIETKLAARAQREENG